MNLGATTQAIHDQIVAQQKNLGINWSAQQGFSGGVYVSGPIPFGLVAGTGYDPTVYGYNTVTYVSWQITFIGKVHNTPVTFAVTSSSMVDQYGNACAFPETIEQVTGTPGTPQTSTAIAMTPDGNFVETWDEQTLCNDTSGSVENLYFRQFAENTDTAGPIVTRVTADGDTRIDNGQQQIPSPAASSIWWSPSTSRCSPPALMR